MISKSGDYFLGENVDFDPTIPNAAAIVINADNVTLRLCNKTLRQKPGNTRPGTIGILINGVQNVSIEGGTIRDFNLYGIFGNPNNDILQIEKLNVINCGTSATVSSGGMSLLVSTNIKVYYSNFIENFALGVSTYGCKNYVMDHCGCNNTQGSTFEQGFGTAAVGFEAAPYPSSQIPAQFTAENIILTNSTFNNSSGGTFAIGLIVISENVSSTTEIKNNTTNIIIENCVSMGITAGSLADESEGFATYGSNIVVRNCVADSISAGSGTPFSGLARGFRSGGYNILFENCVASNISGSGQIAAAGFVTEFLGSEVTWRGCTAYNISNSGTPGTFDTADAYGFGTLIKPGIISRAITPIENQVFLGTGNVFESCLAENVTSANGTAAGFRLASQENIKVKNCISNYNKTYGFWFKDEVSVVDDVSTLVPSINGLIEKNYIEGNGAAGIFDETSPSANNAYIANIARSNGGIGDNYTGAGLPAGTPIRIWTLPGFPGNTNNNAIRDAQLDNMDIRP